MTTLGFVNIGGLGAIESGLNELRRSQLMIIPEFKYMYGAIQKHHNDLKFAHITGMAKDLLDHAIDDTKFYNILIKMLCEVKQRRTGEQRAGLHQIYTWYLANKHVLYNGPRFGKEYLKEQAKDILHKALSARKKKRSVSASERQKRSNISDYSTSKTTAVLPAKENLDPSKAPNNLSLNTQEMEKNAEKNCDPDITKAAVRDKDDSSYTSSDTNMSRPKTAISVTISHLNDKHSHSYLPASSRKVTTMVHPLSSLVNPHVQMSSLPSNDSSDMTSLIHVGQRSKPDHLQAWQEFNRNNSYGQDIVGKLNFVGRSGTALDVRYSAHNQGESPEMYTEKVMLQHYSDLNLADHLMKTKAEEKNYYAQQTLEDFCQTADSMRPTTRNSSRMSLHSRAKSAIQENLGSDVADIKLSSSKQPSKFDQQLDSPKDISSPSQGPQLKDTGVLLATVVKKIDSVSNEMTYFKEKLVTQPHHGFRQPSVAGLPTPREDVTIINSNTIQSTSDNSNYNKPLSRPVTANCKSDFELSSNEINKAKIRCKSAGGIDWRGRIEPDSMRYKWSKTKFGSHTYLKKWIGTYMPLNNSNTQGKRPKTAPSSTQEKWKTEKETKARPVQAASHDTTVVDQKDVDGMMTIQLLVPGDDGVEPRSFNDYDQKFWKRIRKSSSSTAVEHPKEFVSFVSPTLNLQSDQKGQPGIDIHKLTQTDSISEGKITGKLSEQGPLSYSPNLLPGIDSTLNDFVSPKAEELFPVHAPSHPNTPHPQEDITHSTRCISERWMPADKNSLASEKLAAVLPHQFSDVQLDPELFCSDCQPNMKTSRVERSAGRMPTRSVSAHLSGYSRTAEVLKKAPPIRTPPSIPSPQFNCKPQERTGSQIFIELEHHARRTKSPRSFMQKVEGLRSVSSPYYSTVSSSTSSGSLVGTSLQVCRLPVGKKTPPAHQILAEYTLDLTDRDVPNATHSAHEKDSNGSTDLYLKSKHVSFSDLQYPIHQSSSAPTSSPRSSLEESELGLKNNNTAYLALRQSKISNGGQISTKPLAKIGRPIAQVTQVTDPDDLEKATQLQREAAAAVDIQRIFRGFVARTAYKSLLKEARWKREDDQKALLEIQRTSKEHNQRMNAIYNRSPLSPEIQQWSNEVKSIQQEKALKRQDKMNQLATEMIVNQKESKSKLSSVGPHIDIYSIYHPKIIGPTMKELNQAATKIQKIIRGWMVRRKIEKLSRKATWYGSSFTKMTKEYKLLLKQVQSQHGVEKPKTPFSIKDFNAYIDKRRRYESVFDKKAFSGSLEVAELKAFFTECDLHPAQTEIDEALDVTTHGQAYKSESKGLTKREVLDLLFYIYVPSATGLHDTRKSTWMNPIINGEEGRKLLGSEFIEPAPLEPCANLVFQAKKEQRQKEKAVKEAEERRRIEDSILRTEERKQANNPK